MKKICCFIVISLILIWGIGGVVFAWKINHLNLKCADKQDAIIALTGGRNRIGEAIKLLEQKKAKKLFISGVGKEISLENILAYQHFNLEKKNNIYIGHDASNTIENAKETNQWVKENNVKSICLVTSNYHILRSLQEFMINNPNLKISAHPVYSDKIEKKWWTSWRTFSLIAEEYNKFVFVFLRNKFNSMRL